MTGIRPLGIVVFDGIERLNFEGAAGILGWAARVSGGCIHVKLMSKDGEYAVDHLWRMEAPVAGRLSDFDGFDFLLVPGGDTQQFADDAALVAEVKRLGVASRMVVSVCNGAFLVAAAGLADGRSGSTHWSAHTRFRKVFQRVVGQRLHPTEGHGCLGSAVCAVSRVGIFDARPLQKANGNLDPPTC